MEPLSIIIIIILLIGFAVILYFVKNLNKEEIKDDQSMLMLQNQLNEIRTTLDSKLGESAKQIQEHLKYTASETSRIVGNVTEKLTKLDETNRQVVGFADQLKSLQDILKNPKQRGILGEYYLETVLKNVLPTGSYQMQYAFKDNVIVDAVVFVDKHIIPIDSKFSLENYNRILETEPNTQERKKYETAFAQDLKNRIDETSKYIKPQEDTMDFAFMFIPSEAIYYDLLVNKIGSLSDEARSLVTYAGQKKVIIVSPTSFLAYLQTVLQGLRNQKISEQAKEITKQVEALGRHMLSFDEYMGKLGKNLGTTVGMYNKAYKELGKIDKDVLKVTGENIGIEPEMIEAPAEDGE